MFIGGPITAYGLATADVVNTRTEVSEWFAMWSILALTNLCTADIVSVFGETLYTGFRLLSLGLLLILLFMALGFGSIAFCRLVLTEVLHLALG